MTPEEYRNIITYTLRKDVNLSINKKLIKELGILPAVFLSDLISKQNYFVGKEMDKDLWFFNTEENREEDTGLTPHQQRKCIQSLKENEIIRTKRIGIPAKLWFWIDHKKIFDIYIKLNELYPLSSSILENGGKSNEK